VLDKGVYYELKPCFTAISMFTVDKIVAVSRNVLAVTKVKNAKNCINL